MELRSLIIHNI